LSAHRNSFLSLLWVGLCLTPRMLQDPPFSKGLDRFAKLCEGYSSRHVCCNPYTEETGHTVANHGMTATQPPRRARDRVNFALAYSGSDLSVTFEIAAHR